MIRAGATAFRLNTSHLSLEHLQGWVEQLEHLSMKTKERIPVVLDLQGSKWRLGDFPDRVLEPGERIELVCAQIPARKNEIPVPHADFFQAARQSGEELILNDAKNSLQVEAVYSDRILARVVRGGTLLSRKGITFDRTEYRKETLSEKDQTIVNRYCMKPDVSFAISYVKDHIEAGRYRDLIGPDTVMIAKLERQSALNDVHGISKHADALWLCRGDLGAELGIAHMAQAVHRFTSTLSALELPVILAGQVLEHMRTSPQPTRSEICYFYDSLMAGYSGCVLSDETAIGQYPVASCAAAAMFCE